MQFLSLLIAQQTNANRWLSENPFYLGLLFLVIGGAVGGWGVFELMSGVSRDKYGNEVKGGIGKGLSVIRIVVGAGLILFALYKMVAG